MASKKEVLEFHATDRSKIRNKIFRVLLVPYKSKKDGLNKLMLVSAKTGLPLFHVGVGEKGATLATTLKEFSWEGTSVKNATEVEA